MAREHRAESVSMRAVLLPRVGRGDRRQPAAGLDRPPLLQNILAGGFTGSVYAVNPEAEEVQGLPAHARVGDIPGGASTWR